MECKKYSVRHPLDGDPPEIFQIFSHKGITCEKVARANLVNKFDLDLVQTRPESTRTSSSCL